MRTKHCLCSRVVVALAEDIAQDIFGYLLYMLRYLFRKWLCNIVPSVNITGAATQSYNSIF